jgi:DamX protein
LRLDRFFSRSEPSAYYSFSSFEQRLHILQRLVQGKDFIILVVGETGSGKTTLLNRFLRSTAENWQTCRIRAHITGRSSDIPSLDNLHKHPAHILQDEQIPIVMFDDAHGLTPTELKYLLQDALAPGSARKLKRLVLFGEPPLLTTMGKLTKAIGSETAVNKIYMPALTEAETAGYLWHRLTEAGFRGKNPFAVSTVKKIHKASHGLPGRINVEARKYLEKKYSSDTSVFGKFRFRLKRLWGWVGGGVLVVVVALWVTHTFTVPPEFKPTSQYPSKTESVLKKKIKTRPHSKTRVVQSSPPNQKIIKNPKAVAPQVNQPASKPKPGPTRGSQKAAVGKNERPPTAPVTAPAQVHVYREKWLLQQSPSFYTIQIMGGRNEEALRKYVQTNLIRYPGPLAYYQTKLKGGPWFPLLYGIYPTRKQALTAKRTLPQDIQKLSPWIRKLSSVQKAVKEGIIR